MLRAILALLFAILYLIIGIPVLFVEWIIGKFNRQAADISQLRMVQWAFRVILIYLWHQTYHYRRRKCSKRPACSLYWQSQELFRYHHHLLTLSAPDRLCSKRFHEKGSSFICLDEQTALSVHQSFGCQRSVKNDPCRNRQYQKRDFDVYFP